MVYLWANNIVNRNAAIVMLFRAGALNANKLPPGEIATCSEGKFTKSCFSANAYFFSN